MRISDWSSDVCSSDLHDEATLEGLQEFSVPVDRDDERAERIKKYTERRELAEEVRKFLVEEGVLASFSISDRDNGIVRSTGGGSRKAGEPVGVPELGMIAEHYNQVIRALDDGQTRSEKNTSDLQSLIRISYAGFCLKEETDT